jgi:hypothetical protein
MLLGNKQSVHARRATSDVKQRFKIRTNLHRPAETKVGASTS